MKKYLSIFILFYLCIEVSSAQKSANFYSGINMSSFRKNISNSPFRSDTNYLNTKSLFLPSIGFDVDFSLRPKVAFSTGIGLHFVGVQDFVPKLQDVILNDSKLKMGYFRIPLQLKYQILPKIEILGGYAFNYIFRKNQNFFAVENLQQSVKLTNIFHQYHHDAQIGVIYKATPSISIQGIFNMGLNPIASNPKNYATGNFSVKTSSVQLLICYTIQNIENIEAKKKAVKFKKRKK